MKIPKGWKLVPIEPTADMRVAYYDCVPPRQFDVVSQKWKAMLSAAPTPPNQFRDAAEMVQDEPVRPCRFNVERTDTGVRVCWGDHERSDGCEWEYYDALTSTAQDEPVAVIDECDEGKFADLLPEGTFLKRGTKLYAHPQSDKLREAAEKVVRIFHDCERDEGKMELEGCILDLGDELWKQLAALEETK